jgi:hypothetical protein
MAVTPSNGKIALTISGLSIVNGAQTTGAIGSLRKAPAPTAHVAVRLIKTGNRNVVYDVIRYNNTLQPVTPPVRHVTLARRQSRRQLARDVPREGTPCGRGFPSARRSRPGNARAAADTRLAVPEYVVCEAQAGHEVRVHRANAVDRDAGVATCPPAGIGKSSRMKTSTKSRRSRSNGCGNSRLSR